MRELFRSGALALCVALTGGGALVSAPALSASQMVQLAQLERRDGGERGGMRGGERGARSGGEMRGPQIRGDDMRGGRQMQERMQRRDSSRVNRPQRGEARRFDRQRTQQRRDFRRDDQRTERRGDRRQDRRWERRDRRDGYQRFHRNRPEYRSRYPFVFLGGPRIIVRGYGPGWCRGPHRGYHWAPRVGWHYGSHNGLYRC